MCRTSLSIPPIFQIDRSQNILLEYKKQNSSFVEYKIALDTIFGINLNFVMLNTNDATIPVCDQTQLQPQYSIELILIAILHHRVINYEKS